MFKYMFAAVPQSSQQLTNLQMQTWAQKRRTSSLPFNESIQRLAHMWHPNQPVCDSARTQASVTGAWRLQRSAAGLLPECNYKPAISACSVLPVQACAPY